MTDFDCLVLGAGPAGAAAALGLTRLGLRVAVISQARAPSYEGLSVRSLSRLHELGLEAGELCASSAAPRWTSWAGEQEPRGHEYIIERATLDRGLQKCLIGQAVESVEATIRSTRRMGDRWLVETSRGPYGARSVLDCRGRRVRRHDECGPPLVAWSALYEIAGSAACGTAVAALEAGWCWIARTESGLLSVQTVTAAGQRYSVDQLADCARYVSQILPELRLSLTAAKALGSATARAAVARYTRPAQDVGFLRVGDASVAMDPLSGQGIHEALGSARIAVAAISSYLTGTEWPVLKRFVDERARELWHRCVRAAAGFYRRQADHRGGDFWEATATAYEHIALRAPLRDEQSGRFEMRPVLNGSRIEMQRVWVSPQWPRGVWKIDGRVLAHMPAGLVPSILRRAAHHEVSR